MHFALFQCHAILLLLILLTQTVLAIPVLEASHNITERSVNLKFNKACPDPRQKLIKKAWDDAQVLAANVGKIDFNDVAAVEFFGPPALNKNYQSNIQAVFDNAKTFNQGWFGITINLNCGPDTTIETDQKCKKDTGTRAYTRNTKNSDGTGGTSHSTSSTPNMYFCNSFFLYSQLDDRIKEWKDSKQINEKYNMDYYRNMGYITLHELMHADRVSYKATGSKHIADMTTHIYEYEHNLGRQYTRRLTVMEAYGAQNTKILARTFKSNIAQYIITNADNYAQYALAKYVQKKIGAYPFLPIASAEAIGEITPKKGITVLHAASSPDPSLITMVLTNGSDWGLNGGAYEEGLKDANEDLSSTFSTDPSTNMSTIVDSEDIEPPLDDLQWIPDDKYPPEYITQLNQWIAELGNPSAPSPTQSLLPLSAFLSHGPVVIPTRTPTASPTPTTVLEGDTCDVSYKFLFDSFEVRGKGWTDAQLGDNGANLKTQISGCGDLTDWNFQLTPTDCCYQWYASGRLPIGVKNCVGRAVVTAGGSGANIGNCHGAG